MLTVSEKITTMLQTKYFGPAEVLDINEAERSVLLRFPGPAEELEAWARIAIPTSHHFAGGDRVLIAGEDAFNLYVIGLLEVKHEAGQDAQRVKTENGAYATVNKTRSRETVQVRSGSGELVFEYDPEHGKSRVNVYSGDLEFVTRDGDINFVSGRDIRFFCKKSISMLSLQGIRMAISNAAAKITSSMSVAPDKVRIDSQELDLSADKGTIALEETSYSGKKLSGVIQATRLSLGRFETTADTIICKAKNVYKTVEGLTQLHTKRMRTMIASSCHFKSKKAFFKAEDDFKIKGEKIHIG